MTIITDGKGNYLTEDSNGNWVPTSAPQRGDEGFATAPPEKTDAPPSTWRGPVQSTPDLSNIPTAAAEGWKGGAVFQDEINKADQGGPFGPYGSNVLSYWIGSPLMKTLDLFPQTANALYRGGQQALEEALTPFTGRAAGHEISGMPEAFLGSPGSARPAIPDVPAPAAWPPRQFGAPTPGVARPFVQEYHGEPVPGSYGPPPAPPPPPPPGPPSFVPPGAQPGTLQRVTSAIQADTAAQATRPAEIPPNANVAAPDPVVAPGNVGGAVTTIRNPQLQNQMAPTIAADGSLVLPGQTPAVPPRVVPPMTSDQILERSQGYYSPADKQASQGATINPTQSDAVRSVLTNAIPTDPEKAALIGNTPIVQMAKSVQPYTGQPMSFDTAMSYDRQLTAAKQAALRSGDNDMARQLGEAQDAIRTKMQSLGPDDTTGDPSALANLAQARQAYSQYIKQSQMEDLQYRASLLPEDKQDAYMRSQATSMLRGNQTRNWSPEERAALEQALQSGNIGSLKSLGLSFIKPFARMAAGTVGSVFGPAGAFVGGEIGGDLGATATARARLAMTRFPIDAVSQQISQGVPPPNRLGP
jgi:hypothetical protein